MWYQSARLIAVDSCSCSCETERPPLLQQFRIMGGGGGGGEGVNGSAAIVFLGGEMSCR